jgi:hypothetical protein
MEEEKKETINDRIRIIMTREGHNVNTFSKKVGIPWTTVKNLISSRNLPSYEIIVKIIDAFDWVDANYLILGELYDKNKDTEKLYSIISILKKNRLIPTFNTSRLVFSLLFLFHDLGSGICTSAQNFLTEGDDFQYFFLFLQQIKNANNMKKTFAMMIAVGIILAVSGSYFLYKDAILCVFRLSMTRTIFFASGLLSTNHFISSAQSTAVLCSLTLW